MENVDVIDTRSIFLNQNKENVNRISMICFFNGQVKINKISFGFVKYLWTNIDASQAFG